MDKEYSDYLKFLASDYNILYIGDDFELIYDEVSLSFLSSSSLEVSNKNLKNLNIFLKKRDIDIVIFNLNNNEELILKFFNVIKDFNNEIMTFLIFKQQAFKNLFELISSVDIILSYPINKNIFQKKLFTLLSSSYTLNSIGRKEIKFKEENISEDSIDDFFDIYEGSALFLADEFKDIVKKLDAGNISNHFFMKIAQELDEVANIFSNNKHTISVTIIYENLASYLRNLDLETIEAQNLSGFTYLSEILDDVSLYLINMFVDRIFKDIYVFEQSLINNIEFMKNKLLGIDEDNDESELEFF